MANHQYQKGNVNMGKKNHKDLSSEPSLPTKSLPDNEDINHSDGERNFEHMFQNAQVPLFRSKIDGSEILAANNKFAELIECTIAELLNKPAQDIWADSEKWYEMIDKIKKEGAVTDLETRIITQTGKMKTCLFSIKRFPELGFMEGSVTDISDRKRMVEALALSEKKFHDLFQNAPVPMFGITIDGSSVLATNDKLAELLECTVEEILKNPSVIKWVNPKKRIEMLNILKEKGIVSNIEIQIITTTGKIRTCLLSCKMHKAAGYLEESYIDITEWKEMKVALAKSEKKYDDVMITSGNNTKAALALSDDNAEAALALSDDNAKVALALSDDNAKAALVKSEKKYDDGMITSGNNTKVALALSDDNAKAALALSDDNAKAALVKSEKKYDDGMITNRNNAKVALAKSEKKYDDGMITNRNNTKAALALSVDNTKVALALSDDNAKAALALSDDNAKAALVKSEKKYDDGMITSGNNTKVALALSDDNAKAALALSDLRYNELIEKTHAGLVCTGPDGTLVAVNPFAARVLGYNSPQELLGKQSSVLFAQPVDGASINELVSGKDGAGVAEITLKRKDGTLLFSLTSITVRKDGNGKIIGFDGLFHDITETKKTLEELKQATIDLSRSNKDLEQFAYVASHDLQEPLRMVASYVQLLEKRYKGKLDKNADEFIAFAVEGATRMQRLINDLLTYSRIRTRGKPLQYVDINDVMKQVMFTLELTLKETGAKILWEDLPTITADETQMVQLFQNLIGNGIKFHGSEPTQIKISTVKSEKEWLFNVKDNGIGIDMQYKDRIFVVFQRLHGREEYPGTGIGLAICKSIVERHGGRIWMKSVLGKGTTFSFTIPIKEPKAAEDLTYELM